jgi:flagellar hook-associated protein 1 FlgK
MSGGVIGGVLEFQKEVQRPAQNEIGRLAAVLAESFNELHRQGYDLNGNTGADFFNYSGPNVVGSTRNTGTAVVTAAFVTTVGDAYDINGDLAVDSADIAQLKGNWQASDYELRDNGATWSLTRLSDNTNVALTANANGTVTTADGFVLNININATIGAQADGDHFLIRPFQNSAADISVAIDNPREFAAANSVDPAYELEYLGVSGADTNWKITRLSDGFSTTVTDVGTDGFLTATDTTLSGLFDEGFEVALPGAPAVGDKFQIHPFDSSTSELTTTVVNKGKTIERNVLNTSGWDTYSGGVRAGNNENALALVNIQTDKLIGSGTSTLNDAYNQLVSSVGIKTNQAKISMKAQGIMLEQAKLKRDNISGVNLDEEAADLIRYQQAYQAAAKVMAAADQMFKTLMSSLG